MFDGLGIATHHAPLSDDEETHFDEYFAFKDLPPSEYYALPREKQIIQAELSRAWHLNALLLTRTATKKQ